MRRFMDGIQTPGNVAVDTFNWASPHYDLLKAESHVTYKVSALYRKKIHRVSKK